MSRFERCLLYGVSVLVLAGLFVSGLRGMSGGLSDRGPRPVVHAADIDENAPLDILRRAVSFAQDTCVRERARAVDLEESSMSLSALRGEISSAHRTFISERDRWKRLEKSSVPGDRTLAKDALQRSHAWQSAEQLLKALYMAEVGRMTKEAEGRKARAKDARQRSEDWHRTEQTLKGIFTAEIERMKKQSGYWVPESTGR